MGPDAIPVLLSRLPYDKAGRRRPGRHRRLRRPRLRRDHPGHPGPLRLRRRYLRPAGLRRRTTATTQSSGPRGFPTPAAGSAPWASPTWAPPSTCWRRRARPTCRRRSPPRPPADFHQAWVYHTGGAFELGWQIPYADADGARHDRPRRAHHEPAAASSSASWRRPSRRGPRRCRRRRTGACRSRRGPSCWSRSRGYLGDYLRHPEDGPTWWALNVERRHARDRRAHVPRHLVVRHLPARRDRQLLRPAPACDDRGGPGRPEAAHRSVGPPVSLHEPDVDRHRRHRLRAGGARSTSTRSSSAGSITGSRASTPGSSRSRRSGSS